MYTLEQLQKKSLKELKEIGWELNVLPEGDRRFHKNWVNAIVGVNPPLLELLETSPAEDVQAQDSPIIETVEASPTANDAQTQNPPFESKFGRIVYPRPAQGAIAIPQFKVGDLVQSKTMLWGLEKKSLTGTVISVLPRGGVRVCFGNALTGYGGTFDFSKSKLEDLIQAQEPIVHIDGFVNTSQRQEPIAQAAETSPGVKNDDNNFIPSAPSALTTVLLRSNGVRSGFVSARKPAKVPSNRPKIPSCSTIQYTRFTELRIFLV